jgi:hypothetical protein
LPHFEAALSSFTLHRFLALAASVVGGVGLLLGTAVVPRAAASVTTETRQVASVATQTISSAVGIAGWPDGLGYWVAQATGGVVADGGARYYGSLAGRKLNAPVVGIAATPTGKGYWLVEANGGVYGFGTAHFYGSMAGHHLLRPFVGMAATPDGRGYWLVAADGGVFTFGDARFWGSVPGKKVRIADAIGLFPTHTGAGYYVETPSARYAFGTVYPDVPTGAKDPPVAPVVSAAVVFRGLCIVSAKGAVVVYRTVAVYHSTGTWSEQLAIPRPVAVASTAVSRNLFVLDALGQVKVVSGPGPVPVR